MTVDRSRPLSLVASPVLSARSKLALTRGYLRLRSQIRGLDPYALTDHAAADHGTAHDLCVRYFNDEVTEQLVDPILRAFAGTGARNASGLSVLAAFAVGTKKMVAIEGGMARLPEALSRRLDVRCGAKVTSVDDGDGGVTVGYRGDGGTTELKADRCVLAVPYHEAVSMWPALRQAGGEFGRPGEPVRGGDRGTAPGDVSHDGLLHPPASRLPGQTAVGRAGRAAAQHSQPSATGGRPRTSSA